MIIMEIALILFVIASIGVGFLATSIVVSLQVAMTEGMILEKYGIFVKDKFYLKPFGGCGHCTVFWMGVLLATPFFLWKSILIGFVSLFIYHKLT